MLSNWSSALGVSPIVYAITDTATSWIRIMICLHSIVACVLEWSKSRSKSKLHAHHSIAGGNTSSKRQRSGGSTQSMSPVKKQRIVLSTEEKDVLRRAYGIEPYPSQETVDLLASKLCRKPSTVVNWFHNYRYAGKYSQSDEANVHFVANIGIVRTTSIGMRWWFGSVLLGLYTRLQDLGKIKFVSDSISNRVLGFPTTTNSDTVCAVPWDPKENHAWYAPRQGEFDIFTTIPVSVMRSEKRKILNLKKWTWYMVPNIK